MKYLFILLAVAFNRIVAAHQHTKARGPPYAQKRSSFLKNSTASKCLTSNLVQQVLIFIGYAVNGAGIPNVNFDIGESYAGLMPITTDPNGVDKFYFWFFPTTNPDPIAQDEILIWLNGGPGKKPS